MKLYFRWLCLGLGTLVITVLLMGLNSISLNYNLRERSIDLMKEYHIKSTRERKILSKSEKDSVSLLGRSLGIITKNIRSSVLSDSKEAKTNELLVKLYNDLQMTKTHVQSTKGRKSLMNAISTVSTLIKMADLKLEQFNRTTFQSKHICPEIYKGTTYGYPFFEKGFETTNCSYATPLGALVTIVLIYKNDDFGRLRTIIDGILKGNTRLNVIVGTFKKFKETYNSSHVSMVTFSEETSEGKAWNVLIEKVRTEYALIAYNITTFNKDVRLERLIREIEILKVKVAGGAYREQNGHWKLGCFQSVYKNFTLVYREGYDESLHECIFCDYINAPFVTRTDTLKEYKFNDIMSGVSVFKDFFLRLAENNHESIICPDSMFNVHKETPSNNPNDWKALAKKWQLYRMKFGQEYDIHFSCDTFDKGCFSGQGYLVPPCCLKELADMVKFIMKLCEDSKIICELQEGTLLGAVKLYKVLPWERDADLTFLTSNFTAFSELKDQIKTKYAVSFDAASLWCCVDERKAGGKAKVHSRHWHIEMYGQHIMDSEMLLKDNIKPTKVLFDGQWVAVPRNPGLHARNRYGREIYAHAQHWMTMGQGSGWINYETNKFSPCSAPNHHNCLDLYNADGNIPYEIPVP